MNATMSPVVEFAQPHKILSRFHPRSDIIWIADAGIVSLKPSEVHSILQAELNMGMM